MTRGRAWACGVSTSRVAWAWNRFGAERGRVIPYLPEHLLEVSLFGTGQLGSARGLHLVGGTDGGFAGKSVSWNSLGQENRTTHFAFAKRFARRAF